MKPTRMELYKQAIEQLQRAVDELDQCHATLKDIGEDVSVDLLDVGELVDRLLKELKTAECDECHNRNTHAARRAQHAVSPGFTRYFGLSRHLKPR